MFVPLHKQKKSHSGGVECVSSAGVWPVWLTTCSKRTQHSNGRILALVASLTGLHLLYYTTACYSSLVFTGHALCRLVECHKVGSAPSTRKMTPAGSAKAGPLFPQGRLSASTAGMQDSRS